MATEHARPRRVPLKPTERRLAAVASIPDLRMLARRRAPRAVFDYTDGGAGETSIETGNPDLFETAVALNPTGHMGTPEEVAGPVVFLASPLARRISGTNLVVDGALTRGIQM